VSALTIRRLIVWVVSMVIGTLIGWLIITFLLPALSPDPNAQPVTIDEYGRIYFLTTVIPIGLVFVTWLDRFVDTRIWPD
jgi:ABC-type antimicrobial peptide transport system permease subunit